MTSLSLVINKIFNYLVKFVDLLDIDLENIALKNIDLNSKKYPPSKEALEWRWKKFNNDEDLN